MTEQDQQDQQGRQERRPEHVPAQQQPWPGSETKLDPPADHGEQWRGSGRLEGKRVLVTGGDSGIGRAVCTIFAHEGATVFFTHLDEEAADAEETLRLMEEAGRPGKALAADLRTLESNRAAFTQATEFLGGLDVLVCNAAYQMSYDSIEEFPEDQLVRTFSTNVFSPFWLTQDAAQTMGPGSAIIVTTSIQAFQPSQNLLDYAATKAALNNFVVNLAADLGPRGIRVNAVAPGPIWTRLIPATMPEEKVDGFGSDTPLGRPGQPAEVAAAFLFLAGDEASYCSGTVIGVTGGRPVF